MGENPALKDKHVLYCNFCGKSQHEVIKLIAGPTAFICNECTELCMDIVREESKENEAQLTAAVTKGYFVDTARRLIASLDEQIADREQRVEVFKKYIQEEAGEIDKLAKLRGTVSAFMPPDKSPPVQVTPTHFPTPTPPLES